MSYYTSVVGSEKWCNRMNQMRSSTLQKIIATTQFGMTHSSARLHLWYWPKIDGRRSTVEDRRPICYSGCARIHFKTLSEKNKLGNSVCSENPFGGRVTLVKTLYYSQRCFSFALSLKDCMIYELVHRFDINGIWAYDRLSKVRLAEAMYG